MSAYISLGICVLLVIFLMIRKYRKNIYYKEYKEDDLFDRQNDYNTKNEYYLVCNESRDYIKRYVIRKSTYEKSLVCNFTKKFGYISYFIVCYGGGKKPISVMRIVERKTSLSSKIIALPKGTKKINIFIQRADDDELNSNIIKPISKMNITLYSIFSSIALFTGLYGIRYIALSLILTKFFVPYLNTFWNYIGIAIMAAIAIVYLLISLSSLILKNTKNRKGGALEYEFF